MADAWKRLNEKVKEKRTKKDPPKDHRRRPKGEELTVQRLSVEVSGKAQKYTRINWASGIRAFRRGRRDDDREHKERLREVFHPQNREKP